MKTNYRRYNHLKLQKLLYEVMHTCGVDKEEAAIISEAFVWSDLTGRDTQGIGRFPVYLRRFHRGLISSPSRPKWVRKRDTIYLLDGNNGFGQYLGHVAMLKAIDTAAEHGIGVVGVSQSNHFGAGAYYVNLAAQRGMIGFAFSNSVPHVAPFGGISAVLGTNPFAFAVPMRNSKPVLIDFSTGASSGAMVMKAAREGSTIPEGIVIDEEGNSIVDAKAALHGVVLPFGGAKGFCIGLAVEILSGVITGAGISQEIASLHRNFERHSNVGHFFVAMDVSTFMPIVSYYERMDQLVAWVKDSKPQKGVDEVLVPGERRWRYYERQLREGIELHDDVVDVLAEMTTSVGVLFPWHDKESE